VPRRRELCDGAQRARRLLGVLLGPAALGAPSTISMADLCLPPLQSPPYLDLKTEGDANARALAHYSTALQFEAVGKLREALTHYLEVVKVDPANGPLVLHTAELAHNFQGREAALKLLESALAQRPDDPAPYLNLAQFCATYAPEDPFEKDRVENMLQEALKRFPRSADVYGFAVTAYLSAGRREAAVKAMEQAAQQPVKSPQFWLGIGRAAQQVWPLGQTDTRDENVQKVNLFFQKALAAATGKGAENVRMEVVQYYLLTNQIDQARELCERMTAETGHLQARKLLYRLYEAAGEKDRALTLLEKIVEDVPADVEQRRLLASVYQAREEPAKAAPHLEAAIQIGGGDAEDYRVLSELLLRGQLYEKAIQICQRAVKLFPDAALFHVHAAVAYRTLQQMEKAVAAFASAAEIAESGQGDLINHRFYYQYGITLERAGRYEEAGRVLEKAITLTPKDDIEEASNMMNYLGYMWVEQGMQLDNAGKLIKKANELQPDNAAYIDSLGWWHYKKGEYVEALKELERAISLIKQLQPEDAEIVEHVGHVHAKMGKPEKAREQFLKALALEPKDEAVRRRIEDALKALPAAPPGGN
jgi:tetratricopeptide (TPR) repeat protein